MIISGNNQNDILPVDSNIIEELSSKDEILKQKIKTGEIITESDIEDARQRIEKAVEKREDVLKKEDDIKTWDFLESLKEHPLYKKRGRNRTIGAAKILEENVPYYKGYLIPGQVAWFRYDEPATKDKLDWYDKAPCTIFFGYVKNKQGKVRELGFNLHYYPPFVRKNILQRIFRLFKEYFIKNFNEPATKELSAISYIRLIASLRSAKLDVGIREYIPGLRSATRVIPTKFLPDACLTEGIFDGATVRQIYNYWKTFKR